MKAYIDKARLAKAEEMLTYSEFNISMIAHELGFRDLYSFSRFFKSHTGISPREYMKKHSQNIPK